MALVLLNAALGRISGTVDGYVFRRHGDKIVLQRKPVFTRPRTPAQVHTQSRFSAASAFARQVRDDPLLRQRYAERARRLHSTYRHVAMSDFLHPPTIGTLLSREYRAGAGGPLTVRAYDNFEVVGVALELRNAAGDVVAAGDAAGGGSEWTFVVPAPAPGAPPAVTATVTAFDRPGNSATRTFPLA